jgi:formylglycine-generating enzyme required for sulfatase activity
LPPEILADQYLLEARKALEKGDSQKAIQALGKIEALDIDPPPEFAFFAGKMLVENSTEPESLLKGQALLKEFVISAGRGSAHYTAALELLSEVGAKVEEARHLAKFREILPQMVRIEGGTFTMGCSIQKRKDCSQEGRRRGIRCTHEDLEDMCHSYGGERKDMPAHRVQISSFEISKSLVTYELWKAVMGEDVPPQFGGCCDRCPQCPVMAVSWNAIQTFLQKLNAGGGRYRLPSEAEWEYTARGGAQSRGYRYIGSNDLPVEGQAVVNELGLHYMLMGPETKYSPPKPVYTEWLQDCWHPNYRGAPSDGRAWESEDCTHRVQRSVPWGVTTAVRLYHRSQEYEGDPDRGGYYSLGFRVARSLP